MNVLVRVRYAGTLCEKDFFTARKKTFLQPASATAGRERERGEGGGGGSSKARAQQGAAGGLAARSGRAGGGGGYGGEGADGGDGGKDGPDSAQRPLPLCPKCFRTSSIDAKSRACVLVGGAAIASRVP